MDVLIILISKAAKKKGGKVWRYNKRKISWCPINDKGNKHFCAKHLALKNDSNVFQLHLNSVCTSLVQRHTLIITNGLQEKTLKKLPLLQLKIVKGVSQEQERPLKGKRNRGYQATNQEKPKIFIHPLLMSYTGFNLFQTTIKMIKHNKKAQQLLCH